jgi:hypothetical protein
MPSVKLSPLFNETQFSNNGVLLSGGQLTWYFAGTSTLATTYQNSAGTTPHQSTITLTTRGEPPAPIFLIAGSGYKAILQDAVGNTIRTVDNIYGINDTGVAPVVTEWIQFGGTATYINTTTFSVVGDQTAIFTNNRRVRATVSGADRYATISPASTFGAGVTTVILSLDSGTLDNTLNTVYYGLLNPLHPSFYTTPQVVLQPGTVVPFAGTSAPTGYLACPTAPWTISRTTYSALFAAIGTTWGNGNGSTTFNAPYFPDGYAALSTTPASVNAGSVQGHVHVILHPNFASSVAGTVNGNTSPTQDVSGQNGDNLAAGMGFLMIIKY